ncbi:TerD family protein [Candidatus Schmidhempelia bombi]|uniref:Tellurium resistance protein TerA n=1 Tax=Candidatus Schmidhempelia bombi str. Bimp TaxID=1387197 RepID=A0AB94IA74_9GAMM|nr:TerD family protein [Candidatus Schmidhempelia bombi]TEA26281.1 tellurium resistance protein TerA [Candidatus Schmidhempelia bombi str. Bimp]
MFNLSLGANIVIPTGIITVKVNSDLTSNTSAFQLLANGKVKDNLHMIFQGQPKNNDDSVIWEKNNKNSQFIVDLPRLSTEVQKICFAITCDEHQRVSDLKNLAIQLEYDNEIIANAEVDVTGRQEKALIIGEIYRRNNEWKFRYNAHGFNNGLTSLTEHFGVSITDELKSKFVDTTSATTSSPTNTVGLSKISLSKEKKVVNLAKQEDYGKIGINLNWHKNETNLQEGFFSKLFNCGNNDIDLDLGAFVRLRDNNIYVIQALGNSFGSLDHPYYVKLMGDDRSGANKDGEWIYINGSHWNMIDEILVYAFIYDGVPSWDKTDGVVRIHIPGQPTIETCLTEGDNRKTLCAIARLKNVLGSIKVERINQYFHHQGELDNAYGWGFRWAAGQK